MVVQYRLDHEAPRGFGKPILVIPERIRIRSGQSLDRVHITH